MKLNPSTLVRKGVRVGGGYAASSTESEAGDPVELIVEKGKAHSLIVLKASEKSTLNRWFMGSVSHEVLKNARNSVMIIR